MQQREVETRALPDGGDAVRREACGFEKKPLNLGPPRLAKNTKLFAALKQCMKSGVARLRGGLWVPEMTVPIDSERLIQLFELIARGLAQCHWETYLPADTCAVEAAFLTSPDFS